MNEICIPLGYGSGPYAVMAYAGSEFCNTYAANQVPSEQPESNVRDLCLNRC